MRTDFLMQSHKWGVARITYRYLIRRFTSTWLNRQVLPVLSTCRLKKVTWKTIPLGNLGEFGIKLWDRFGWKVPDNYSALQNFEERSLTGSRLVFRDEPNVGDDCAGIDDRMNRWRKSERCRQLGPLGEQLTDLWKQTRRDN